MNRTPPETWRLHIDWTRCEGRGLCSELLPDLIARDDWGYPRTREPGDPVVARHQQPMAREAAAVCPRMALTLVRTPTRHAHRGRADSDQLAP